MATVEQARATQQGNLLGAQSSHLGESTHVQLLPAKYPGRRGLVQLAAVCDDNLLRCLPILGAKRFYFLHNIHAFFDMAKHHMFAIQPVRTGKPGEQKQE